MENEVLLAKLQEQLQNAIEGHRQITNDLRTIFNRIDEDGKTIVRLDSEMKSGIEKSAMRKEAIDNKIKELERTDEELKKAFEEYKKEVGKEEQKRKDFELDIKATYKTITWIFGGISVIGALVATIVAIMTYIRGH